MLVHSDGLFVPAFVDHGVARFTRSADTVLVKLKSNDGLGEVAGGPLDGQRINTFVVGYEGGFLFADFLQRTNRPCNTPLPVKVADIVVELHRGKFCVTEVFGGPHVLGRNRRTVLDDAQLVLTYAAETIADKFAKELEYDDFDVAYRNLRSFYGIRRFPYGDADCERGWICFSTWDNVVKPTEDIMSDVFDYVGSQNRSLPLEYITEMPILDSYPKGRRFWAVCSTYADHFE